MAIPVFRAVATASGDEATSLTITKPTGTVQDDVLLVWLFLLTPEGGAPTITAPSGWTQLRHDADSEESVSSLYLAWKLAGASEPANYQFTWTGASDVAGHMLAYSGGDTTTPIDVHGGQVNASSTNIVAPSVTTTKANTKLVGGFGHNGNQATTPDAAMTERSDAGTADAHLETADEDRATAGATGTRTATIGSAAANIGQLVAINEAAAAAADVPRPHQSLFTYLRY